MIHWGSFLLGAVIALLIRAMLGPILDTWGTR